MVAEVNVVDPVLVNTTRGVTLFPQVDDPETGFIMLAIEASSALTGVQPLDDCSTFHGGLLTTATIRAHCCALNITMQASSV